MNDAQAMKTLFKQKRDNVNILKLLGKASNFLYLIYDNLAILAKIKVLLIDKEDVAWKANFFWLCALLFTLAFSVIGFMELLKEE